MFLSRSAVGGLGGIPKDAQTTRAEHRAKDVRIDEGAERKMLEVVKWRPQPSRRNFPPTAIVESLVRNRSRCVPYLDPIGIDYGFATTGNCVAQKIGDLLK